MYKMKTAADKMKISVHTLRYYANEGLFPHLARNDKGIRLFTDDDLEWVFMVQCLRDSGMPIEEIKRYFDLCEEGDSTIPQRYEMILEQKQVALKEIEQKQYQLSMLEWKIGYYNSVLNDKVFDRLNPARQFIKAQVED